MSSNTNGGKTMTTRYGIEVELEDADVEKVVASLDQPLSTTQKLGCIAGGLLADLAGGGIMVSPEHAARVRSVLPEADANSIAEQVERAAGRHGESLILEWEVDPTYVPYMEEIAQARGCTVREVLQQMMDFTIGQGIVENLPEEPRRLTVTEEDYRFLRQLLGKENIFGADLVQWARNQTGSPFDEPSADDVAAEEAEPLLIIE